MDPRNELEQRIWELVYDLLPPDEASALRRRIDADPDAAHRYARVRRQAALLRQAARLELSPIVLTRPSGDDPPSRDGGDTCHPVPRSRGPAARQDLSRRRWPNWLVASAAAALLCYLGATGLRTRALERALPKGAADAARADRPLRTVLFGPSQLQPALPNYFAVRTQTAGGVPQPADVAYRLQAANGALLASGTVQADDRGLAQFDFRPPPADSTDAVRMDHIQLEVATHGAPPSIPSPPIRQTLSMTSLRLTTALSLDRSVYRPGDRVRCRAVIVDRAELRMISEAPVEFSIVDADGRQVAPARRTAITRRGVAFSEFELPRSLPPQRLTLAARSPTGEFVETRRAFAVRADAAGALRQRLAFARDDYQPGDEVEAILSVSRADGSPAADEPLAATVSLAGQAHTTVRAATDHQGTQRIRFRLPDEPATGDAVLSVAAGQTGEDRIAWPIPIHASSVRVAFFPESGTLVAGVMNRIYFLARDAQDRPVRLAGRILDRRQHAAVDEQGRPVLVRTADEGRGMFTLRPEPGDAYRLVLDAPLDKTGPFDLPVAREHPSLALDAAPGVLSAGAPIRVRLRTHETRPLVIIATCRDAVAAQQLADDSIFAQRRASDGPRSDAAEIAISLPEFADGVIRIAAYDYSVQPPQPVAERLVFRRPARELSIRVDDAVRARQPGEMVELTLSVQDERGRPQPAVLGVAIADEAALHDEADQPDSVAAQLRLTSQLDDTRGIGDASAYLSDGPQAARMLDLLLGTQSARRPYRLPTAQLALADGSPHTRAERIAASPSTSDSADEEPTFPIVLADTKADVVRDVEIPTGSHRDADVAAVRAAGHLLIGGSLVLALALGFLSIMRRAPTTAVGLAALGVSVLCMIVGGVWSVGNGTTTQTLADATARPKGTEIQLAQADKFGDKPMRASGPGKRLESIQPRPASDRRQSDREQSDHGHSDGRVGDQRPTDDRQRAGLHVERSLESRDHAAAKLDAQPRGLLRTLDKKAKSIRQALPAPGEPEMPAQPDSAAEPDSTAGRPSAASTGDMREIDPAGRLRRSPDPALAELGDHVRGGGHSEGPALAAPMTGRAAPDRSIEAQPYGRAPSNGQASLRGASAPRAIAPPGAARPADVRSPPPAPPAPPGAVLGERPAPGSRHRATADAPTGTYRLAPSPRVADLSSAGAPAPDAASRPASKAESSLGATVVGPASPTSGEARRDEAQPAAAPAPSSAVDDATSRASLAPPARAASERQTEAAAPSSRAHTPVDIGSVDEDADSSRRPETILWDPAVECDGQGRATLRFRAPRSTGTYRVLIDAHADGRFGSYRGSLVIGVPQASSNQ